jgi:hypothetical protein
MQLALNYATIQYPDLAAGEAYMTILLCDEIYDEDAEFHNLASEAAAEDTQLLWPDNSTLVITPKSLEEGDEESFAKLVGFAKVELENWA